MKIVWILTIATLLLSTLGEFGQFPFGSAKSISLSEISLLSTLITLFVWQVGIKKKIIFPKILWWIIGFWIVGLVGLVWSGVLTGGLYLVRFMIYSLSAWLGFCLAKNLERWIWIIGVILAELSIFQLIILPDLFVLSQFGYDPHINRAFSSLLDPNFFGAILCLILPIGLLKLSKKWDVNWMVGIALILLMVVLTFSRSAYLALAIELGIFGIFKWRKALVVLIAIVVLGLIFVPKFSERVRGGINLDASAKERIESWQKGLVIWQTSPVIGVGFDNVRYVSSRTNLVKIFSSDGGNSGAGIDSGIIFILATTGLLGLVIFIGGWIMLIKYIPKSPDKFVFVVALVGLCVDGQFINSWFYPPIMLIVYLWAGALLGRVANFSGKLSS